MRPTKPERRACSSAGCRNLARSGRRRCHTCGNRAWRERHPDRHAFDNLRTHARERGKVFTISFADFAKVAVPAGYVDKRGRTRTALHIDRRDHRRGYEDGNLAVLTNAENVRKQHAELRHALGPKHTRAIVLAGLREHREEERRAA